MQGTEEDEHQESPRAVKKPNKEKVTRSVSRSSNLLNGRKVKISKTHETPTQGKTRVKVRVHGRTSQGQQVSINN